MFIVIHILPLHIIGNPDDALILWMGHCYFITKVNNKQYSTAMSIISCATIQTVTSELLSFL